MLDQRSLKSLRSFATVMLLISIAINGLLVLQSLGYGFNFILGITILDYIRFCSFALLFVSFGSIYNKAKNLSQEVKDGMRSKMRLMILGILLFIIYIAFVAIVIKDIHFVIAGFIMLGIYVDIVILTEKIIALGLNDHKMKWRAAVEGIEYNEEGSSILWRFKLWFTPFERVPFEKRSIGGFNIFAAIFFMYALTQMRKIQLGSIIILLITAKAALSILEYILGLYTSLIGVCTGIEHIPSDRERPEYWTVYITDFKKEREVTYRSYTYPFLPDDGKVKVTHGIFSKNVILINDRPI